jgi:hypothetical protein
MMRLKRQRLGKYSLGNHKVNSLVKGLYWGVPRLGYIIYLDNLAIPRRALACKRAALGILEIK